MSNLLSRLSLRAGNMVRGLSIVVGLASAIAAAETPKASPIVRVVRPQSELVGLSWIRGDRMLMTAHSDGKLHWWKTDGTSAGEPWVSEGGLNVVEVSRNGDTMFLAKKTPLVEVWNRRVKKIRMSFQPSEPARRLLLASDSRRFASMSTKVQVFELERESKQYHFGNYAEGQLGWIGFVDQTRLLAYYDKHPGQPSFVSGMDAIKYEKTNYLKTHQMTPDGTWLVDTAISAEGRVVIGAVTKGILMVYPHLCEPIKNFVVLKNFPDEYRVLASKHGRYAICLHPAGAGRSARGLVWDLVEDVPVVEIGDVPAKFGRATFHPDELLLAIDDLQQTVTVWDLGKWLANETPPGSFLKGKVTFQARSARKTSPESPLQHPDWYFERWSHPQAPAYLKEAWKYSPHQPGQKFNLVEPKVDGTLFWELRDPDPANAAARRDEMRFRNSLRTLDGWKDLGPCPWNPKATLFSLASQNKLFFTSLTREITDSDTLLFVPGSPWQNPETASQLPGSTRFAQTRDQVQTWLRNHQFAEIEKLANASRKDQTMFGWGQSALGAVYAGLDCPRSKPAEFQRSLVEGYLKAHPQSVTAQIAWARWLSTAAFEARGGDLAQNLSQESRGNFQQLLASAQEQLRKAAPAATTDPYLEASQIKAAAGSLDEQALVNSVLSGLRKNPQDPAPLLAVAPFLLERWSGRPDAGSKLATRIKTEFPGDPGQALAAVLALQLFELEPHQWGTTQKFDYQAVEVDLAAFRKLSPDNPMFRFTESRLAVLHAEPDKAREIWQKMGTRVDLEKHTGISHYMEWTSRIEKTPQPALLWAELGLGSGKIGFSPEGKCLISANPAGRMQLWNAADGQIIGDDRGQFLIPLAVGMPAGDHVVVASQSGLQHFEVTRGIREVAFSKPLSIRAARLSPDGSRLVAVDQEGAVHLIEGQTGKIVGSIPQAVRLPDHFRLPIAISSDNARAAVRTSETTVELYQLTNGRSMGTLRNVDQSVMTLSFHNKGTRLSAISPARMWTWDVAKRAEVWTGRSPTPSPLTLEVSEDGRFWAVNAIRPDAGAEAEVLLLKRGQGTEQWRRLPEVSSVAELAWHPTRPHLAVYSNSGILSVWDTEKVPASKPVVQSKE